MNLTGKILLSLPNISDNRFYKSVIYVCAHTKEGAMGIIINKSLEMELYPNLLKQLGIDKKLKNNKILFNYGGPIEPGRGFVLHSDEFLKKESMPIENGIVLTSTSDIIKDLSIGKGPKICMLALGYTGWGPEQLDQEIFNNGWVSSSVNSNFIFDTNIISKWEKAYSIIGIDPNKIHPEFGQT